jgi:hypothetical protein
VSAIKLKNRLTFSALFLLGFMASSHSYASSSYVDYLDSLGRRESSNNYSNVNPWGYLGRYQFGEAALGSCQLFRGDHLGTKKLDWVGTWLDEASDFNVSSKDDFLASHPIQEFAIRRFNELQWASIIHLGLTKYIGKSIGGILITRSGMLGGAHLVGPGKLKRFLVSNGNDVPVDGNGTEITEYISLFSSFDVPFH